MGKRIRVKFTATLRHLDSLQRLREEIKLIEARLNKGKWRRLKLGDVIRFRWKDDPSEAVLVKVTALLSYPTFDALLRDFPPEKYFDPTYTHETLLERLRKPTGIYYRWGEDEHGVIGVKVETVRVRHSRPTKMKAIRRR